MARGSAYFATTTGGAGVYYHRVCSQPYRGGGGGAVSHEDYNDPFDFPQQDYYDQQQQQVSKRARVDTHPSLQLGYVSGVDNSCKPSSGVFGGARPLAGSLGATGAPYDFFGVIAGDESGASGGYGGGYPVPFEKHGGRDGDGVSGWGRAGGVSGGGLGVTECFDDGLEEVRGGIVGGAALYNAAALHNTASSSSVGPSAASAATLYAGGGGGSAGSSSAGRFRHAAPRERGGAPYSASIGGRGVLVGDAYGTSGDEGRYSGCGGLLTAGSMAGAAEVGAPPPMYAGVQSGMVGGRGGIQSREGRGGGALMSHEYDTDFYPGDRSAGVRLALLGAPPAARDAGGETGGGYGGYINRRGGGSGKGLMIGVGGVDTDFSSGGHTRTPDQTRGDGTASAGGATAGGSATGAIGSSSVGVGVGVGVMEEDQKVREEEEDAEAGIENEGPLGGWTAVEGWAFKGLPLGGKSGKRASRDIPGPIHVFEGKDKPGVTGWPAGITWMVSETYRGNLEKVKWPSSLVGIVLMGFNRPITNVEWPEGLAELHLRGPFDQIVEGARFPQSLTTLSFGAAFNQPVEDAEFPDSLEGLYFGDSDQGFQHARFNQPLAGMAWPSSLLQLSAGLAFDQSLEGADWPDTLEVINIMGSKKQPLEDIEWPPGLKQIHLNGRCRKEAPKAAWPRNCKVYAWSLSSRVTLDPLPPFGTTNVGLSSFSGHNSEQIFFDY